MKQKSNSDSDEHWSLPFVEGENRESHGDENHFMMSAREFGDVRERVLLGNFAKILREEKISFKLALVK